MKKKIILLCILIAALVLEALPNGVVIYFANPEGDPFRETYSYFSLTPYGYANIFPLITAVMTCVLLLFTDHFHHIKKRSQQVRGDHCGNSLRVVALPTAVIWNR